MKAALLIASAWLLLFGMCMLILWGLLCWVVTW